MTTTHTFAILDVSAGAFEEIKARLEAVGHKDRIQEHEGRTIIVMQGIAIRCEDEGPNGVKCYLVYDGQVLKEPKK